MNKLYSLIGVLALFLMIGAACDPQAIPVEDTPATSTDVVVEDVEEPAEVPEPVEQPVAETPDPIDEAPEGLLDAIDVFENQDPDEEPHRAEAMNAPCSNNAQCIPGKLCQDGECLPAEDVLPTDPETGYLLCNNDAQCWGGKVCNQGRCVPLPDSCNFHPECYSDSYMCIDNSCVGPGLHQKTCANHLAERWFCPTDDDCGETMDSCIEVR